MNNLATKYTVYLASAGCGKTYSLVENYLCALFGLNGFEKKKPANILALTFSEKAALEMRLRINERLANWLIEQKDPLMHLGIPVTSEEIKKVLRSLALGNISTFHGFCAGILREFGHKFNINHNFEILLPHKEQELAKNIIINLILKEIKENNLVIKNLSARFGLDNGFNTVGLIDTIWFFYTNYLENGFSLHNLSKKSSLESLKLKLNQAFLELKEAIYNFGASKLNEGNKLRAATIIESLNNLENFNNLTEHDIVNKIINLENSLKGNFAPIYRKNIIDKKNNFINILIEVFLYDDEKQIIKIIHNFHEIFSKTKKESNLFSYFDLLIITKNILCEDPLIRSVLKNKIKHILIDEYQDTSSIQEDIIFLLLENINNTDILSMKKPIVDQISIENGSSLFVVGDKKQSIYGFRGAKVSLFDNMLDKMSTQNNLFSKKILTTNRRSDNRILALTNMTSKYTLAAQNYGREEDLVGISEHAGQAGIWVIEDNHDFAYVTAVGIYNLITCENKQASDIVVLLRRIKPASSIKMQLNNFGIKAKIIGGEGFFQRQEIVDILAFFKLLLDPNNSLITLILLRSPFILLTDNEILTINLLSQSITITTIENNINNLELNTTSKEKLQNFLRLFTTIKLSLGVSNLSNALDLLLNETEFLSYYALDENKEQILANIKKLSGFLSLSHENHWFLIEDLWQQISTNKKEPQALSHSNDDCVSIMTIHQSKGLEFNTVVLADLETNLKSNKSLFIYDEAEGFYIRPKGRAINRIFSKNSSTAFKKILQKNAHNEFLEEARLLYVAMTRAKKNLYFAYSNKPSHKKNLINLLLWAKKHEEENFNNLCPVITFNPNDVVLTPKKREMHKNKSEFFVNKTQIRRIFCSNLKAINPHDFDFLINKELPSFTSPVINGRLAHKILALSLETLSAFKDYDQELITQIVNASSNTLEEHVNKNTKNACIKTLLNVTKHINKSCLIYLELHLLCENFKNIILEGFADLVIEYENFVGVIDFKSDSNKLIDKDVFMQIFAYAACLKNKFNKPVKFALVQIGLGKVSWQDYNEVCQNVFMNNLRGDYE